VEVVLLSVRGSGAAHSVEWATLAPAGAAGVVEGAPGALDVLAVEGAMMCMHVSILVDSVGPPSAEVCRAAASFP
jgi:hypothetical protein